MGEAGPEIVQARMELKCLAEEMYKLVPTIKVNHKWLYVSLDDMILLLYNIDTGTGAH